MSYTTNELADFITLFRARRLAPLTVRAVQRCLLDLTGAALAGSHTISAEAMHDLAKSLFLSGGATAWFRNTRFCPPAAALVNAAAASALDIDDGHRAALGHPGASIIPAAIVAAQEVHASGRALITAIALGYDVAVRVAASRYTATQDTLSTGRWCAYGAAAAAGFLYGTRPAILAQALAIAGVHSPGLSASGYSKVMGNHVKEGIPWATFTGLSALQLASSGFSGPLDILDHPDYFDAKFILEGLGDARAVEGVYFKPYACCRWIHSAIDALREIIATGYIQPADVQVIEVHTFERALRLNNYSNPDTLEGAQYSINFCLAVLAIEGPDALMPLSSNLLGRQGLVTLAGKIRLFVDAEIDRRFPAQTGARVVVQTPSQRLMRENLAPLGDPANPMDFSSLASKFKTLTASFRHPNWQNSFIQTIESLPETDLQQLCNLLVN